MELIVLFVLCGSMRLCLLSCLPSLTSPLPAATSPCRRRPPAAMCGCTPAATDTPTTRQCPMHLGATPAAPSQQQQRQQPQRRHPSSSSSSLSSPCSSCSYAALGGGGGDSTRPLLYFYTHTRHLASLLDSRLCLRLVPVGDFTCIYQHKHECNTQHSTRHHQELVAGPPSLSLRLPPSSSTALRRGAVDRRTQGAGGVQILICSRGRRSSSNV